MIWKLTALFALSLATALAPLNAGPLALTPAIADALCSSCAQNDDKIVIAEWAIADETDTLLCIEDAIARIEEDRSRIRSRLQIAYQVPTALRGSLWFDLVDRLGREYDDLTRDLRWEEKGWAESMEYIDQCHNTIETAQTEMLNCRTCN